MSQILDALNPSQRQAAQVLDGPALILAGAGSGKTRTLTHRAAHLVADKGVEPGQLLVITFTNRAAGELRQRLDVLLDKQQSGAVWAMTFHALCLRMLRQSGNLLGIANDFTVLDSADSRRMIAAAAQALEDPAYQNKDEIAQIRSIISRAKNSDTAPDQLSGNLGVRAARIWQRYMEDCKTSNSLDFDDLLLYGLKLLENPAGQERWGDRFRYVMVDEYQDVNGIQEKLLRGLCVKTQNLFAIGDDSQSVYAWRGAQVEHILRFTQNWPQAKLYKLEQNYRSAPAILRAAQAVIERSKHRSDKQLVPVLPEGKPVRLLRFDNHWDEAAFIADRIGQLLGEGIAPDRIAVAYRTNAQSQAIEEALVEKRIPYQVVGGVGFSRRVEIQAARAYMALLANPRDRNALERVAAFPRRGIGPSALEKVYETGETDLIRAMQQVVLNPPKGLNKKAQDGIGELVRLFGRAQDMKTGSTLGELLHWMINASGIVGYLKTQKERGRDQLENLDGLQELAERYPGQAVDDLQDWLADTALRENEESQDETQPGVKLMTMHASKGLEFAYMFLPGLEEQLFLRGDVDSRELDEARRILYVGMTRAEQELIMSFADRRRLWGRELHTQPLQFLFDLPQEVVRQRAKSRNQSSGSSRPGSRNPRRAGSAGGSGIRPGIKSSSTKSAPPAKPQPDRSVSGDQFQPGMQVGHAKFGPGTVLGVQGEKVRVRFVDRTRELQVQYAKLQIL